MSSFKSFLKEEIKYRPLSEIAREIKKDWKNPAYAKPYLDAMLELDKITDKYYADDAKGIVLYFLSNAASWRGEVAKRIKAELKAMSTGKPVKESLIFEAKDLFTDVDVIKLDPDRADAYDVVSALMPTLVRMAYTNLVHERTRVTRGKDEEDSDFEFTADALDEEVEKLVDHVVKRFEDQNSHDRLAVINRVKSEFKDKLEEKK